MCGITGIIDYKAQSVARWQLPLERMSEAIKDRGPDDWGVITMGDGRITHHAMAHPAGETMATARLARETVMLAHRRLAIIDLSDAGHQPMVTDDRRFWIIFNGEIYNYRQLRSELESDGARFHSTSDTEVLLALYAREGVRCLEQLRGMFAFAIWDEQQRQLFLARDRFGMKPLYYAETADGAFVFASELQAILDSGLVSAEIDREAEIAFLQRGSIAAPRTFYRSIRSLPPASFAVLAEKQLRVESYWSLAATLGEGLPSGSLTETAERIQHALIASVQAHMVADVPVGVFLSGGLDSTAIVAAIRRFYSGPLRTFSIIFPRTEWDESRLARAAADYYATEHSEMEVSEADFFASFDAAFAAMDQPTIDGVNTYFVAQAVKHAGGKVALSGLGGDELLGGYKSFVSVPRLARLRQLTRGARWLGRSMAALALRLPVQQAPKLARLCSGEASSIEALWHDYRALFTDEQIRDYCGYTFNDSPITAPPVNGMNHTNAATRPSALPGESPFWSVARLEIEQFMIPQLLRDADAFTMCHSLELRTPFVDHVFLRAAVQAGSWSKGRVASPKLALFRAMKNFLPLDHLDQPKRGFTFPFTRWLQEALANESSPLGQTLRGTLGAPPQRRFIELFIRGQLHWSRLWALYVLERFREGARQS